MNNNRILKFRVWDKHNKRFFSHEEILNLTFNLTFTDKPNHTEPLYQFLLKWQEPDSQTNYIIQQFTNLLDKNNKEIYEGDLVEFCIGAPWDNEQPLDLLGEVVFENGGWFFKGIKTNSEDDYLVNYETRTIKGNVFETPIY